VVFPFYFLALAIFFGLLPVFFVDFVSFLVSTPWSPFISLKLLIWKLFMLVFILPGLVLPFYLLLAVFLGLRSPLTLKLCVLSQGLVPLLLFFFVFQPWHVAQFFTSVGVVALLVLFLGGSWAFFSYLVSWFYKLVGSILKCFSFTPREHRSGSTIVPVCGSLLRIFTLVLVSFMSLPCVSGVKVFRLNCFKIVSVQSWWSVSSYLVRVWWSESQDSS